MGEYPSGDGTVLIKRQPQVRFLPLLPLTNKITRRIIMVRNRLYYENRISLLESRHGRENGRIIAKLRRVLRKIDE